MTLQSVSLKDIYDWTPKLTQKIQTLPGFVDVSSDLLIASPQVRVDIDRDRACRWVSLRNRFKMRSTVRMATGKFRTFTHRQISTRSFWKSVRNISVPRTP